MCAFVEITPEEAAQNTQKYWDMMGDPLMAKDLGLFVIITVHVNLFMGTIGQYVKDRPDLRPLVDSIYRFDTEGVYLLTERGHGLDAFNIETTATRVKDGFILNTPREEARK